MLGLLAGLPRENCWTIAEHACAPSPDGTEHRPGDDVPEGGVYDSMDALLADIDLTK